MSDASIRFVHFADVHLGFRQVRAVRACRRLRPSLRRRGGLLPAGRAGFRGHRRRPLRLQVHRAVHLRRRRHRPGAPGPGRYPGGGQRGQPRALVPARRALLALAVEPPRSPAPPAAVRPAHAASCRPGPGPANAASAPTPTSAPPRVFGVEYLGARLAAHHPRNLRLAGGGTFYGGRRAVIALSCIPAWTKLSTWAWAG